MTAHPNAVKKRLHGSHQKFVVYGGDLKREPRTVDQSTRTKQSWSSAYSPVIRLRRSCLPLALNSFVSILKVMDKVTMRSSSRAATFETSGLTDVDVDIIRESSLPLDRGDFPNVQ